MTGGGEAPAMVLASRSPQRRAILEQLGIHFRVEEPRAEELSRGDPRPLVVENARRKALSVEGDLVLGVDTAVVLDGRVFGKPAGIEEAATHLRRLSGRTHEVHSGVSLRDRGRDLTAHAVTRVHFRPLEQSALEWYLATGEWRERAGGYAIQGRGAALVAGIEGDYTNVVGLPVAALVELAPGLVFGPGSAPGFVPPTG
jgi:septum formation protein